MRQLLVLDEHNYDESMEEIVRISVRGIFFVGEKLVLIESDDGEVKLPGGGQEKGEDDIQTLCREVNEETGYHVIPHSVVPFGEIIEKRLSTHEPMIWHQINRLYFCDVEDERDSCQYTDNEKKYGFHLVYYTIDEALNKLQDTYSEHAWCDPEYRTLILLREYYCKGSQNGIKKDLD